MKVHHIGIVFDSKADAEALAAKRTLPDNDLKHYYHWRYDHELEQIGKAIEVLGYKTHLLGNPKQVLADAERVKKNIDFIINLSVGFVDRFRMALGPALYELLGIPYSGADPYSKMVSQNKHLLKSWMQTNGLPTPAWQYIPMSTDGQGLDFPPFPLIVKPAHEGSSVGVTSASKVYDRNQLMQQIDWVKSHLGMAVLVEQFIEGREFKVAYIGNQQKQFRGMIEDVLEDDQPLGEAFLYFDIKKAATVQKRARNLHHARHEALFQDCDKLYDHFLPMDYGSFDIRVDAAGQHYFLEFQADATLHPERTLAECCRLNGVKYENAIQMILRASFERWGLY